MGNIHQKGTGFAATVISIQVVLERATAFIGALTIMALMFLTTAEVVGRYVFNHPIPGSYEMSEFLLIGIVFLAIAYVQSLKGHIAVELFGEQIFKQLSHKAKIGFDILGYIIGLMVLSINTCQAWLLAWRAWYIHDYAMGLAQLPLWPAKTVFAVGISLLSTRLVLDLIHDILKLKGMTDES